MEHPFKFIWLSQPWYCILLPLYNLFTELQPRCVLHLTCNVIMTLCRMSKSDTEGGEGGALYRGPANAPSGPSRYLVITSSSIYSLLTVGAYEYVLNRHHRCQNVQNGCLHDGKDAWFWKEKWKCLTSAFPSPSLSLSLLCGINSLNLFMKTNHCEPFSLTAFGADAAVELVQMCDVRWDWGGGFQRLYIQLHELHDIHPPAPSSTPLFLRKRSVFFTFIFSVLLCGVASPVEEIITVVKKVCI